MPTITIAPNLPCGMRQSMPTVVQYTLARLRAPTCWLAWSLRLALLLRWPLLALNFRNAAEILARAAMPVCEFEGEASRLGPRSSGEEAWPRLPAAHLLASAGEPRAAEFEGETIRLGRRISRARTATSATTPRRSARGPHTISLRRTALTPVCVSTSRRRSRLPLRRLGRLAPIPLVPFHLAAIWTRAFLKSPANVN